MSELEPSSLTYIGEAVGPVRTVLYVDLREHPRRYFILRGGALTQFWNPNEVPKKLIKRMLGYEKNFEHMAAIGEARARGAQLEQELRETRERHAVTLATLAQYTTAEKLRAEGVKPVTMKDLRDIDVGVEK